MGLNWLRFMSKILGPCSGQNHRLSDRAYAGKTNKKCGQALPPLRPPDEVMKLSRLGSFFPHRLALCAPLSAVAAEDA